MINYLAQWAQQINNFIFFFWPFLALFAPRSTHLPLAITAILGCCTHRFKNLKSLLKPEWILLGLFFLCALASTQWSINTDFELHDLGKVSLTFIALILTVQYFNQLGQNQIQRHLKAFLIGLGLVTALVIIDRLWGYPLTEIVHASPAVTYSRFITLACLGIWGGCLMLSNTSYHSIWAFIIIAAYVIFFWSYDFDAGPVALIFGAIVMGLSILTPKFTSFLMRLGILIGPLLIVGWFGLFMSHDHWQKIAYPHVYNTHQQRIEIIDWASKRIVERPQGYGFSQTQELSQIKPIDSYTVRDGKLNVVRLWQDGIRHLHNGILQIFLELGIIGFLLFASFIWILLGRLYHLNLDRYQLGVMHGYVTTTLFIFSVSFGVWQTWWLSTIMMLTILLAFKVGYEGKDKRDIFQS